MIDRTVLAATNRHLQRFAPEWRDEFPLRLHDRSYADDGTFRWSGEFTRWMNKGTNRRDDEHLSDNGLRLTRSMRKLRKVAPREHEAVWRILSGETAQEVCEWLNDRAERHGHPERYSLKDTIVIIVSGVDKLAFWY